jgi:signal transduction histidine kinase
MGAEMPANRRMPRSAFAARSLQRLRLRVTAWYVGTFGVVLLALGGLLFAALTRDVSADLDSSLRAATHEIALAAARRERERAATSGGAIDAVDELRIPDRQLYLFDLAGHPLTPPRADTLLQQLARRAGAEGSSVKRWDALRDQSLQAFAERFTTRAGASFVAVAVANRDLTDERSRALLVLLGGLGGVGLVLVATGGWLLARKSVAPVELSMLQMQRFMADAAHELRTPVAVMRSRVDVTLEQSRDQTSYRQALAELREEIERVAALVNDLFTLANADAEARPFSGAPVQLDEIVLEAVSTAGWIAARRGITLVVEEAVEVVIDGVAVLLRQLGMILLDNAIKFSDQGSIVKIAVRATAHGAVFVLEDQGAGIAVADVERVFDRFYRAESVRGSTSGAGLGLAIARWITDSHRAQIALEPAPLRGTRVTVTFPALGQRTAMNS